MISGKEFIEIRKAVDEVSKIVGNQMNRIDYLEKVLMFHGLIGWLHPRAEQLKILEWKPIEAKE